jgi:eukaryotic-like serine/threonine-protein kinase
MTCSRCGASAEQTATRCATCGADLTTETPTSLSDGAGESGKTSALQPGQQFGPRYRILRHIGSGGMGAVYQAWDASLGTAVALKVIKIGSANPAVARELEARFKRELLLARKVSHPNVVRIHDLGEVGETKYLTMAFVEGGDLASVLETAGRLPVSRALAIARQIAAGLAAAHDAGVVHRDLKPANVIIDADGTALLTDFGIARSTEAGGINTMPGAVLGTLDYMAPEQAKGGGADRRSDIYAFGLILYELLAGRRPAGAPDGGLAGLLERIEQRTPSLGTIAPQTPPDLTRVVTRCLEANPAARYQSARELLEALEALGPDGVARASSRRTRRGLAIAAAVLVVAVIAAGAWWFGKRQALPAAPERREPISVLIADFENRTADSVFQGSLEQPLALGIEGAAFITTYSRSDATRLAGQLRKESGLSQPAAALVAMREGIDIVLEGSITQAGRGYQVEVRATRPGSSEPFATSKASASDKSAVLNAVSRLAADIRAALGDTTPSRDLQAETFSTSSIEAVHAYTVAQRLSMERKNEEAIAKYREAIDHDPTFGRAWSGLALTLFDMGRREEAREPWDKALSLMDRMTEREKFRTLGGYYISIVRNYDKAIESYRSLVEAYPADTAGHNNLAVAYFFVLDFPKALEQGRRAIEIYPASVKFRTNLALYAMYAGDFTTAAAEAREVISKDPLYEAAYFPLAMAALSSNDVPGARKIYEDAKETGSAGASVASIGLADIALYEGRPADAVAGLEAALPADSGNQVGRATKLVALAEAHSARGDVKSAMRAADSALTLFRDEFVAVPVARVFAAAKANARLTQLVRDLEARPQAQARAYGNIIAGEQALEAGDFTGAIRHFSLAIKSADVWLARFRLGIAYVQAGQHAEAISELEGALKRRGEATAVFLDDVPTFRYLALLPYWLGRAREGLGMGSAAESYKEFLRIRAAAAPVDRLVADARARLTALAERPSGR